MNKVVHFEIPTDDLERSKLFYFSAFGWEMTDYPELNYVIAKTTEVDPETMTPKSPGAINGGFFKRTPEYSAPSISIAVEDIEVAKGKVIAAGGKILKDTYKVGDMGYMLNFMDTEGNALSLWQVIKK